MSIDKVDSTENIDTLRGLACFLLVAYHVIGFDSTVGLKLHEGVLRELNELLVYIRMPLFTFLSGMVYAKFPFSSNFSLFIRKKVRRLLIPMVFVGTLFALIQSFVPGANAKITDWSMLHIIPVAHYWFLEALFLVFVFIVVLESFKILHNHSVFLIMLFGSVFIYCLGVQFNYFSLSDALYLLPYFVFGVYLVRFHGARIGSSVYKLASLFILIILVVIFFAIYLGYLPKYEKFTLEALLLGMLGCFSLYYLDWKSSLLAKVGVYSYSIYLFHVFFYCCKPYFID